MFIFQPAVDLFILDSFSVIDICHCMTH